MRRKRRRRRRRREEMEEREDELILAVQFSFLKDCGGTMVLRVN